MSIGAQVEVPGALPEVGGGPPEGILYEAHGSVDDVTRTVCSVDV